MEIKQLNMKMIPNIFTLANLFFGFLSILATLEKDYILACVFILLAVLMDSMDGKVARRLSVSSDFGKELDSLCDVVSFGVAPAVLTYDALLKEPLGYGGLIIAAIFVLCGATRLARFNVLNITTHFLGVPITFAGGFMALIILFYNNVPWLVYAVCMLILAYLMVSSVKVPKLGK